MALDFGDAGLFDPIPPAYGNGKSKNNGKGPPNLNGDPEENEALNGSNGWHLDEDRQDDIKDTPSPEDEDEDLDEEDWASAPPLDILDCIKGYEMVSFDATSVPPPPFVEDPEGPEVAVVEADGKEQTPGSGDPPLPGGEGGDLPPKVGPFCNLR